ncbi:MAG: copper homeostasis protein CutC [Erysipelotrichaceae bacterium]|nr:copper homeostasis protein CutC [Erysipelotrichaceae bacterium]
MLNNVLIEVCCGSLTDVQTAIRQPIDRIELNTALELGGLTVNTALLKAVKKITALPVCCMVRPRTGGFCYSREEFELMLAQAEDLLKAGADGIVFGFLNDDCTVNREYCEKMIRLIRNYNRQAVFHKAFDLTDMSETIGVLAEMGVDRVLTSGGNNYPYILNGAPLLRRLAIRYDGIIEILPGGGVRAENVAELLQTTGLRQVHCSASKRICDLSDPEVSYQAVDEDTLIGILTAISHARNR